MKAKFLTCIVFSVVLFTSLAHADQPQITYLIDGDEYVQVDKCGEKDKRIKLSSTITTYGLATFKSKKHIEFKQLSTLNYGGMFISPFCFNEGDIGEKILINLSFKDGTQQDYMVVIDKNLVKGNARLTLNAASYTIPVAIVGSTSNSAYEFTPDKEIATSPLLAEENFPSYKDSVENTIKKPKQPELNSKPIKSIERQEKESIVDDWEIPPIKLEIIE